MAALVKTQVAQYMARRLHGTFQLKLYPEKIKRRLGELFMHVRNRSVETIAPIVSESKRVGLPMLGINPDFVKVPVKGIKCLTVRLQGLDDDLNIITQLLALREYKPSSAYAAAERAGKRIGDFMDIFLADLNLSQADLIGGCSDSGSDIKYYVGTELKRHSELSMREWCPPHMVDVVMRAGTGVKPMAGENLNPGFAALMDDVKAVMSKITQSYELALLLEEQMAKLYGPKGVLKPTMGLDHRWLGWLRPLETLVSRWPAFDAAFKNYKAQDGTSFAHVWAKIEAKFQILVEHVAIFKAIKAITDEAQGIKQVVGHQTLFNILNLRLTLLSCSDAKPIKIVQYSATPPENPGVPTPPEVHKTFATVQEATQVTLQALQRALDHKYLKARYATWDKKPRPLGG